MRWKFLHCTSMRGDDIHVNDVWRKITCIDRGFVVTMSYGWIDLDTDWLIGGKGDRGRYDVEFTPQAGREQVKNDDGDLLKELF